MKGMYLEILGSNTEYAPTTKIKNLKTIENVHRRLARANRLALMARRSSKEIPPIARQSSIKIHYVGEIAVRRFAAKAELILYSLSHFQLF